MSYKGWNDPPKVSFDSFQQSTKKKPQRHTITQIHAQQTSSSVPLTHPPKSDVTLQPSRHDTTEEVEKGQVKDIDELLESLNSTVTRYEGHMQKKVLDDVHKRIDSFMVQWKDGKLSEPVKAYMTSLVDALAVDDYTKADQIHIKLMVDHISEVSQWMIGIKKLILTVRTSS